MAPLALGAAVITDRADFDGRAALQILQSEYMRARSEGEVERQTEIRDALGLVLDQWQGWAWLGWCRR